MAWETFIIQVYKWDLCGEILDERIAEMIFRPYTVCAEDELAAIAKLGNRVGYNVVEYTLL